MKNLSETELAEIQKIHDSGVCWTNLPLSVNVSLAVLNRHKYEGKLRQQKFKLVHTDETKKRMSESKKELARRSPQTHGWNVNKNRSVPCERLKSFLSEAGLEFIAEYRPIEDRMYSIDIAFPDVKVGVEINGNQHYEPDGRLKPYYQERHDLIVAEGWNLIEIHFSLVYDAEIVDDLVKRLKSFTPDPVNYPFYIKNRQKYKDFWDERRSKRIQELKNTSELYREKITNSGIDLTKFGWVQKISDLLGVKHQHVNRIMKKMLPDLYTTCFKRK